MRFSRRTLAAFGLLLAARHVHASLDLLFFEFEVEDADPRQRDASASMLRRVTALLKAVEKRCRDQGDDSRILELIEKTLRELGDDAFPEQRIALTRALELDGIEFGNGRLVATTPAPAALAGEVSALELDLERLGFSVAATHYHQAVDNFTTGNWEAANGQVRSFIEGLFLKLCQVACGRTFDSPNGALDHLRDQKKLDDAEWNTLRGFWNSLHDNGPHAGQSEHNEALYRLHVGTAVARYLLNKV